MERMWRKVNQGLTSTTSTVFKQSRNNNNSSNSNNNNHHHHSDAGVNQPLPLRQSASIVDDGPVYANVPQYNRGWGYIDTSKCRKRRRKIKPRRNR